MTSGGKKKKKPRVEFTKTFFIEKFKSSQKINNTNRTQRAWEENSCNIWRRKTIFQASRVLNKTSNHNLPFKDSPELTASPHPAKPQSVTTKAQTRQLTSLRILLSYVLFAQNNELSCSMIVLNQVLSHSQTQVPSLLTQAYNFYEESCASFHHLFFKVISI